MCPRIWAITVIKTWFILKVVWDTFQMFTWMIWLPPQNLLNLPPKCKRVKKLNRSNVRTRDPWIASLPSNWPSYTRTVIKYVQIKAINKKVFSFFVSTESTSYNGYVPFPLDKYSLPRALIHRYIMREWKPFTLCLNVLGRGLIKFLHISVSCRQTEWMHLNAEKG